MWEKDIGDMSRTVYDGLIQPNVLQEMQRNNDEERRVEIMERREAMKPLEFICTYEPD